MVDDGKVRELRKQYLKVANLERFGYVEADWGKSAYEIWLEEQVILLSSRLATESQRRKEAEELKEGFYKQVLEYQEAFTGRTKECFALRIALSEKEKEVEEYDQDVTSLRFQQEELRKTARKLAVMLDICCDNWEPKIMADEELRNQYRTFAKSFLDVSFLTAESLLTKKGEK